jgi:hypothetical protein
MVYQFHSIYHGQRAQRQSLPQRTRQRAGCLTEILHDAASPPMSMPLWLMMEGQRQA